MTPICHHIYAAAATFMIAIMREDIDYWSSVGTCVLAAVLITAAISRVMHYNDVFTV